jgi:hypothetical protein
MSNYEYEAISGVTEWVKARFGYPVVNVELSASQLTYSFNEAVEEYSSMITDWAINTHIDNALGLPSSQDFTMRWVNQDYAIDNSFAQAYSEQMGIGGELEIYKDYFILSADVQEYRISGDNFSGNDGYTGSRIINEIMWHDVPAIDYFIADPNSNEYWVNDEFGWSFMGNDMLYVTPLYYNIQIAMNHELRQRIRKAEYQYKLIGPNQVYIQPVPTSSKAGSRVWYWYYRNDAANRYANQQPGTYVSDPGTIRFDEIPYSAFNSSAQHWVKRFTLALAKETLGRIRSKFSSLPIPDNEVTMDGETLVVEGIEEQARLKEKLYEQLDEMKMSAILEATAQDAENVNIALSYSPGGIYIG